jgi:hypothetical protein
MMVYVDPVGVYRPGRKCFTTIAVLVVGAALPVRLLDEYRERRRRDTPCTSTP